jgi:hypothetical protein
MQALANMLGEDAHIQHDKFWLTKYLRIDALQNKVFFPSGIQGYQEGVIDIAIPKFLDGYDLTQWLELLCNGNQRFVPNKIIQDFASCIEIFAA